MATVDKKSENLVQVYEVVPSLEALQPKPRRPLWRRILFVFLIISSLFLLRGSFSYSSYGCSGVAYNDDDISIQPYLEEQEDRPDERRLKFEFPAELDNFKIHQVQKSILPTRTKLFGKVHVGSSNTAKNIAVYVYLKSNDKANFDRLTFDKKEWGLEFAGDFVAITKQWVNITTFVIVPRHENYKLKTFQVETLGLGISLMKTFKTWINGTYFETFSGEINSYSHDLTDVPHSPYLSAKSQSGSIYGRFGLGHTLDIETKSGNIGVNITNAPWRNVTGYVKTLTISGHNKIQFANSANHRKIITSHKSVSGNIRVGYPEDWEGSLELATVSGKLNLIGKGTKVVDKGTNGKYHFWKGVKGDGESKGYFASISGNVNVGVGEFNWRRPRLEMYP